jgi:curli production assembly/transport component CsgF
MMCKRTLILSIFGFLGATSAFAGELVYTPRNPSFGGNPFYSSHLLGIAGAINKYEDPSSKTVTTRSSAQEFERIIQSSLLARISSEIANQIYGENATEQGRFVIGETTVDFTRNGAQTQVTISDSTTGGSTLIEIPTPGL